MRTVYYVVLAAGLSSRFPGNKLVAKLCGKSVVRRALEPGVEAGLPAAVVTGHNREKIVEELSGLPFLEITNRRYKLGLLSSIKAAVEHLYDQADAILLMLGDKPLLPGSIPRTMARVYEETMPPLAVPSYKGVWGHPVLVDWRVYDDVLKMPDADKGLRSLLAEKRELLLEIPVDTEAILLDVDTPEDLARLESMLGCGKQKK